MVALVDDDQAARPAEIHEVKPAPAGQALQRRDHDVGVALVFTVSDLARLHVDHRFGDPL